jgi:hypothetical protein
MAPSSLSPALLADALARLTAAQARVVARYPGDSGARQPVHTVYGGAHAFRASTIADHGAEARATLAAHAPDPARFAAALGLDAASAETVYARVVAKLEREPVEDFRIDFEDGYGVRSDAEEDAHARAAAGAVAAAHEAGTLSPFIGLRVKPLSAELGARALGTLDLFLTTLVERLGRLPPGFFVTLPKVTAAEQVAVLADVLDALEPRLGIAPGALRLEVMVEVTPGLLDAEGRVLLPALLDAARGRLAGAHLGTYDFTASYDVTAAFQHMRHLACDFAKHLMKASFAGTGVALCDGSTNVLPVGDGAAVRAAWRQHADDIRHSLVNGYYQGWDLHPAQLPSRYGAVYNFFLAGRAAATARLGGFLSRVTGGAGGGEVQDDAATGQALLNFFLRGLASGALTEEEALATGLTRAELHGRSFAAVLRSRGTSSSRTG